MTTLKCLPSMKQNVSLCAKHYLKLSLTTVFVRIMNLRMDYNHIGILVHTLHILPLFMLCPNL